jgi:molybdate transport system permease protein
MTKRETAKVADHPFLLSSFSSPLNFLLFRSDCFGFRISIFGFSAPPVLDILRALHDLPPGLWQALWLTLRLALVTTVFLLVCGIPLAHWLNSSRMRGIAALEALVALPIVLPPTVIGFYLLMLFAPQSPLGQTWIAVFGRALPFSFSGLVVGSVLYSLPFAVQPFQAAFKAVPQTYVEAVAALGAGARQTFWHVRLPMARRGLFVGATLAFAHTLGEFGVVLMLGGSIPGETKVASIALYDEVQKLDFAVAHAYALVLLVLSFALLLTVTLLQRRKEER